MKTRMRESDEKNPCIVSMNSALASKCEKHDILSVVNGRKFENLLISITTSKNKALVDLFSEYF